VKRGTSSAAGALPPPGPELLAHREFVKRVQEQELQLSRDRQERKRNALDAKRQREAEQLRLKREQLQTRRQRALTGLADIEEPLQLSVQPRRVTRIF
jgi:hypothetical protein